MPVIADLAPEVIREALRLLGPREGGAERVVGRVAAARELREALGAPGAVRSLLARAPSAAGDAVRRVADEGPLGVEALLGRGWWGRGTLPPPLDWAQRRALLVVAEDGLVHVPEEVRAALTDLVLDLPDAPEPAEEGPLEVLERQTVVVAPSAALLQRAVAAPGARLRVVAPTVAVSDRAVTTVETALRTAGVALDEGAVVVDPAEPALPGTAEDAVGPAAVRTLLARALADGRQVRLRYFASSRGGAPTERTVDPWSFADDLLRGYCHLRQGERTFAVDRVGHARLLASPVEHAPSA